MYQVPGISRQKSIRTYVMFCFCFPFLFQHGTPTFLVTKVLGICVRPFIRRQKENPPEILSYTKRDSPGGLLNSWIFNFQTRYTAKTRYTFACLNRARPAADARLDQLRKESYRLSSTCGAPRNHTNVPPVDEHV